VHGPPLPSTRLRHLPGLDGLRGLAVLAVVGYHAELSFLPGGFLGVELFFVVSGFLITSLLLAERRDHGRVCIRRFWARRARRLLPALAVVLATVAVVVRLWLPDEVSRTRGGLLAAVGYVTNWELVWTGQSYFETVGRPPLLQHLWSLAVEEQYYLVWPLVVAGLMALGGRRLLAVACVVGAVASTALMWALVDPVDPSRVYYGTDTRAGGLLLGGLLAMTMVAVRTPRPAPSARRLVDVLGAVALSAVLAAFVRASEFDTGLYHSGFLGFAAITAVVVFAASTPGTVLGRALGAAPLVWVGVRSYGLYLWHWPVFQLTRPHLDVALDGPALLALRLALTAALAEGSLRLVERPFREGAFGRWVDDERRLRHTPAPTPWTPRLAAGATVAAVAIVAGAYVLSPAAMTDAERLDDVEWAQPARSPVPAVPATATTGAGPPATTPAAVPAGTPTTTVPPPPAEPDQPDAPGASSPHPPVEVEHQPVTQPPVGAPPVRPVHAVGDSVLLAASQAVSEAFAGQITVDAVVGRQPRDGVEVIEEWAPAHPDADLVVALGNNGILRTADIDRIMAAAGPHRRVAFVSVAVPRRWEGPTNDALRERIPDHPNAVLVDWHPTVEADRSLVGKDGIHPGRSGATTLASSIRVALS
jgi:peptidoglycan/LPS O-acetylase OafA/YrhL